MPEMALAGDVELAGRHEQLVGVLPHRLEHPIPGPTSRSGHHGDDRLVHQAGQHLERQPGGHRLGRLGVEAAHEHGEVPERLLLGGIEELVAPFHRRPHAAVVGRRLPANGGQLVEACLKTGEDLFRGHRARSGRGQLDRQG